MKGKKKEKTCKLCGWPVMNDSEGMYRVNSDSKRVLYCYTCLAGMIDTVVNRICGMRDKGVYKLFKVCVEKRKKSGN